MITPFFYIISSSEDFTKIHYFFHFHFILNIPAHFKLIAEIFIWYCGKTQQINYYIKNQQLS